MGAELSLHQAHREEFIVFTNLVFRFSPAALLNGPQPCSWSKYFAKIYTPTGLE